MLDPGSDTVLAQGLSWLKPCPQSKHWCCTGRRDSQHLQPPNAEQGWGLAQGPMWVQGQGDVGSDSGMAPACSHCISAPHRKALEMGCCIQSSLAKIVAEFEIDLEHYVLQPLNKLSEVVLPALLAPLSNPSTTPSCVPRPPPLTLALSPPGGAPHHPEAQEDPPEVDF